jgi:hypothetical protein
MTRGKCLPVLTTRCLGSGSGKPKIVPQKIENEELDVLSGGLEASPEGWEVFRDV